MRACAAFPHMKHVVERRRAGAVGLAVIAFVANATWAAAEPAVRVKGSARIEAAAEATAEQTIVSGTLVDDTGRPVGEAVLTVRGLDAAGARVELPAAVACPSGAAAGLRRAGGELRLRTDLSGRFCAKLPASAASALQLEYQDERRLLDSAERRVAIELVRRAVELEFVRTGSILDLDREQQRIEIVARTPSALASDPEPMSLVLSAATATGETLLAQASCALGASSTFTFASSKIPSPGPLELLVRFAGTSSLQRAEARVRLLAGTRVRLALAQQPERADPTDGVLVDVALGSAAGAVAAGSVEARLGRQTVGIGKVQNGAARVVARFPRPGPNATLELHYLPSEPWWMPAEPLRVNVELAPRSSYTSLLWLSAFALLALWLIGGWRRPRSAPRNAPVDGGREKPAAAAVVLVEGDERVHGWRGSVHDAHDDAPVPGAVLTIVTAGVERRVLARATAGDDGTFELPSVDDPGVLFIASAPWHSELSCPAPPHGRIRVDLMSRRRNVLARLVRWAERRGPMGRGQGEPTPHDVEQHARRARRQEIADWASAVENTAFGVAPVDDKLEGDVLKREPPDREESPPRER